MSSRLEVLSFLNYMNKHRELSIKHQRLDLVETFYDLADKKAYLTNATLELKAQWQAFVRKWYQVSL